MTEGSHNQGYHHPYIRPLRPASCTWQETAGRYQSYENNQYIRPEAPNPHNVF